MQKLQSKSKTTDELKVALQTNWEELSQEHINKAAENFATGPLTAYMAVAVVTSNICSNSVHFQVFIKFILISSPTRNTFLWNVVSAP